MRFLDRLPSFPSRKPKLNIDEHGVSRSADGFPTVGYIAQTVQQSIKSPTEFRERNGEWATVTEYPIRWDWDQYEYRTKPNSRQR